MNSDTIKIAEEQLEPIYECQQRVSSNIKNLEHAKEDFDAKLIAIKKPMEVEIDNDIEQDRNDVIQVNSNSRYDELERQKAIYLELIKQQEDAHETVLAYLESLETEEMQLRARLEEITSKLGTLDDELLKQKEAELTEYVMLKESIEKLKQQVTQKKVVQQMEEERLANLNKEVENAETLLADEERLLKELETEYEEVKANHDHELNEYNQLREILEDEEKDIENIEKDTHNMKERRRFLNNELQNIKGTIRVYVRVKPLTKGSRSIISVKDNNELAVTIPDNHIRSENYKKEYGYKFEHVFDYAATQGDVFEELNSLMSSVVDGYNVCIFAYGPTGTGKTYTIMGGDRFENRGLAPRAIETIFNIIETNTKFGVTATCSVNIQELYNDNIINLLEGGSDTITVETVFKAFDVLKEATKQRRTDSTAMNDESSRSHMIFKLHVESFDKTTFETRNGTLVLVDLAGSERQDFSKTTGDRFKETLAINKSLTALGDVITAIYKKDKHIPFRNSKLTMMLQDYLVGDAKTLMIVNLSSNAEEYSQTTTSLKFAAKVKNCESLVVKETKGFLAPTKSSKNKTIII